MSRFQRVQQWSAFSRKWFLYDAKWQSPFQSARRLTPVLEGKHKPLYHPSNDCGDHVVVINSKHIALLGREWQNRVYFHHTGFPKAFYNGGGGPHWIPAWKIHSQDPTLVLWKACYNNLYGSLMRKGYMARLHIFPEEEVPEDIMANVSDQIRQVKPVPKRLEEFSEDEVENFPKLWDYPEQYVINQKICQVLMMVTFQKMLTASLLAMGLLQICPDSFLLSFIRPVLQPFFSNVETAEAVRQTCRAFILGALGSFSVYVGLTDLMSRKSVQDFLKFGQCPSSAFVHDLFLPDTDLGSEIQTDDVSYLLKSKRRSSIADKNVELVICEKKGSCRKEDPEGPDVQLTERRNLSEDVRRSVRREDISREEDELHLDDLRHVHKGKALEKPGKSSRKDRFRNVIKRMSAAALGDKVRNADAIELNDVSFLHGRSKKSESRATRNQSEQDPCEFVAVGTEELSQRQSSQRRR